MFDKELKQFPKFIHYAYYLKCDELHAMYNSQYDMYEKIMKIYELGFVRGVRYHKNKTKK